MIKADEITSPNSCLNKALNDEPLFVLRANDELASQLVRVWAGQYFTQKGGKNMTSAQYQKFVEAQHIADQMANWKLNQGRPVASAEPTTALSGGATSTTGAK